MEICARRTILRCDGSAADRHLLVAYLSPSSTPSRSRSSARGIPLLAICRGAQLLNVARGGTLLQHLPDHVGDTIEHRQRKPSPIATHPVRVAPASRLAALLGCHEIETNSFHHQAVDRLGTALRAVAWSADGVVEAIEASDGGFTVGVQWHAECMTKHPEQGALFRGFVEAAGSSGAPLSLAA